MQRTTFLFLLLFPVYIFCQDAEGYRKMAIDKMDLKDYQYALTLIEKAISLNASNQQFYLDKALIEANLYGRGGRSKWIGSIDKAISINPKASAPYTLASYLYWAAHEIDSAIVFADIGLSLAENDSIRTRFINSRAIAKGSKRDFVGAIADCELLLQINPKNIDALNNAANSYKEIDQIEKSISYYNRILGIESLDTKVVAGILVNLGFTYSSIDSPDLAISYFGKALKLDVKQPLVYNNRGYAYYQKGDYQKALADINYSLTLYPSNSYAYRNLGLVYIAMNNLSEACAALNYAAGEQFKENYGDEVDKLIKKYCKK